MPRKSRPIIPGNKHGSLTIVKEGEKGKYGRTVLCDCDCGKKLHKVNFHNLLSGAVKSCGCKRVKKKKPLLDRNLYSVRSDMKTRCYKEEHPSYKGYGAKGILVCEDRLDYYGFAKDLLSEYKAFKARNGKAYLCRRNNKSDFCMENCYWGTMPDVSVNNGVEFGDKFGNLMYLDDEGVQDRGTYRLRMRKMQCDCGEICVKPMESVKRGDTCSCGNCGYSSSHGMSYERIYNIRCGMKSRCDSPNNQAYENYGGLGVCYCDERSSFDSFYKDMGDSYKEHVLEHGKKDTTIDRIDPYGDYSKENCRRATMRVQNNNKRNSKHLPE